MLNLRRKTVNFTVFAQFVGSFVAILYLSGSTARRILHKDLTFHHYEMVQVQKLQPRDLESRGNCGQRILGALPENVFFLSSDKAHFHMRGTSKT